MADELREAVEKVLVKMCWDMIGNIRCSGRRCHFGNSVVNGICGGLVDYRDQILQIIAEDLRRKAEMLHHTYDNHNPEDIKAMLLERIASEYETGDQSRR